ncbi:histidine phosphatase family protein [Halobacillus sp. A1]|uniref:histidine phosphatase family protein n=1 Tax=Halobacillus sp. A1 TaxID=2880262 RepID=UPI0020A62FFD|nr:histidine phosphatase family protein [Halobacillus sp. A1]MCP3032334.1 histidine phosphatase family protein [Halobacillus sp. A1]
MAVRHTQHRSLLSLLRGGGYILYARHAEATVGEDGMNFTFMDCTTQRNLSEAGRKQAAAYGAALRRLRIPLVAPVLASPFCRNRETAELAFGSGVVQVDPFWVEVYRLSRNVSQAEEADILRSVQSRLEFPPPAGTNRVIVAHSFPEYAGLGAIPNMGTVVVKPLGRGKGYEVAGRVSLEELSRY